jgi:parvulin-like peptidyl-prolyl isomerase
MARLRYLPLAALALAAFASAQGIYPGDAVRVNDETISYQRFHGFYVEYRNSKGVQVGARGDQLELLKQLRVEAMDLMIEQELIKQAAERERIDVDVEEVDKQMEELHAVFDSDDQFRMKLKDEGFTEESFRRHVERMAAAKIYLDRIRADASDVRDAEVEQFYAENPDRLTLPERVRVRHILLKWKPMGTQDDRAAIRKQMEPILERARLQPGVISDPVDTVFGVHILKLEERQESRLLPLDEVREQLRDYVREEKMEGAVEAKIDELRAAADIEVLIALPPATE